MRRRIRLTGRGFTLLALGLMASVAAAILGERSLLWITGVLVLLPLLALAHLMLAPPRVSARRAADPPLLPLGETARVVVELTNESPAQPAALRFTDKAPAPLGGGAQFTIARGFGRWSQAVGYRVTPTQRGRFDVGPLTARATDALALAQVSFTGAGAPTQLRVTPRVWALDGLAGGAGLGAAGDATPQRIGHAGSDDVLVREHRHGDDIRRVHWKMTAKQDELMVRLEEHPWDPSSTLILDNRLSAHIGTGANGSLEWAVSAVASVASLLCSEGSRLAIIATSGPVCDPGHTRGEAARMLVLEALTDLPASGRTWLGSAVDDAELLASAAAIVAATGLLSTRDAAALVAAGARARSRVALVPDADAWDAPSPEHASACSLLRNSGWTVQPYAPGSPIPDVWRGVAR
ncbi:MAG: DUF58 domain-containing protein [Tessaracoccus sp.]|uniref:DUF58 domain-containing protein n=1 Tax=Tessaracoccus sp. TaxID=1971211 RepID=UPI001EBFBB12|nr:DUF58 domain-containing protein [Tessaracoccus sp.]MBK7821577.1 DUF58 domain-containing protein [Tessaracoccus sp.]